MPRFSVIVPAYNAQSTLTETLEAISAQHYGDWECVVVDDGSSDDTPAIAQGFAEADSRFRVITQTNQGSAGAYNTGVSAAVGEFIVVCSADDLLLPEHMQSVSDEIDRCQGCDIFSVNGYYLAPDGTRRVVYRPGEIPLSMALSDVIRNCFFSVGATYRRLIFEQVDGYRPGVYGEDYDFWLRAMAAGAHHRYLPEPLAVHRVSATQKSANLRRVHRSDIEILRHLESTASLTPGELRAIDEAVRVRETAIVKLAVAEGGRQGRRVLVVPSWYPSDQHPTNGIFIFQQVEALRPHADVAVLYVREAEAGLKPRLALEGETPVIRAQLKMPPTSRTIPGRARAVLTNLYNKFWRYPRVGLSAFDQLVEVWGKPDIIHVQALWPAAMIARRVSRRHGIPFVVTEHSEEYLAHSTRRLVKYPVFVRSVLRPLARAAARTITVSRYLGDRLVELGLAGKPVVIPNVVPVSSPAPFVTTGRHVIAHVSVMGPAKDLPGLVAAIDRLRSVRTDFVLRLIGDGERRHEIEALVAERGLQGFVEFAGRQSADEVVVSLRASAFTVVSSTHETFSVSAAESLMCGRPVVSTRCGGPQEFVSPAVGLLVDPGDVEALSEGLDWMLDHHVDFDPQALHDYAVSRFAPDVVADQILEVYREVLHD